MLLRAAARIHHTQHGVILVEANRVSNALQKVAGEPRIRLPVWLHLSLDVCNIDAETRVALGRSAAEAEWFC